MKKKQTVRDYIHRKIRDNKSLIKYSVKEKIKELEQQNKDLQIQLNNLRSCKN